jgi:uncharacterized membrane protein YgcG
MSTALVIALLAVAISLGVVFMAVQTKKPDKRNSSDGSATASSDGSSAGCGVSDGGGCGGD